MSSMGCRWVGYIWCAALFCSVVQQQEVSMERCLFGKKVCLQRTCSWNQCSSQSNINGNGEYLNPFQATKYSSSKASCRTSQRQLETQLRIHRTIENRATHCNQVGLQLGLQCSSGTRSRELDRVSRGVTYPQRTLEAPESSYPSPLKISESSYLSCARS